MFVNSDTILNRAMASGHGATLGRRQFFQVGGVTAAGLLLPRLTGAATSQPVVKHVFSFIGEFSTDGAFVSSMLTGPDAGTVDLALSRDPGMGQATFVGQQPVHPLDHMVHHDLGGLLQPGTQYFARLAVGSKMFGRMLAFRTQVADDERMDLQIVLTSCQRNWGKVTMQKGWDAVRAYGPDLLLHMGDFGYWGNSLRATTPYVTHILKYASQLSGILSMRAALETCCSLIQVSDHETSGNNGDNHEDPITATAPGGVLAPDAVPGVRRPHPEEPVPRPQARHQRASHLARLPKPRPVTGCQPRHPEEDCLGEEPVRVGQGQPSSGPRRSRSS